MRKYLPTPGELIDRLTIAQLKEVKIPEHKEEFSKEIEDLTHDIQLLLPKQFTLTADTLRDIVLLSQFNTHIWYNETDIRNLINQSELSDNQLILIAKRLILTHSINGIRNTIKNRITAAIDGKGRMDYKIDCLAADAEHWRPSKY